MIPKYIFFGSPEFAKIILAGLVKAGYSPLAIVCNPDRPTGRNHVMTPPLTKQLAGELGLKAEVLQPEKLTPLADRLAGFGADFFIVAAYAKIIPEAILKIPRLGTIGVHPSLLPKYRGASPIQSVLLAGEKETGVCLYQMDKEMDHGPVFAKTVLEIAEGTGHLQLEKELAEAAAKLLAKNIQDICSGKLGSQEQNHSQATFTKKFETADGEVDMQNDRPELIYRKIKALNPDPGVFTMNFPGREGTRVKLLDANLTDDGLKITEIQPAGKKPIKLDS